MAEYSDATLSTNSYLEVGTWLLEHLHWGRNYIYPCPAFFVKHEVLIEVPILNIICGAKQKLIK